MRRPQMSVVIPTYNSYELLRRCLESLEAQNAPFHLFEVIVVDDGSSDATHAFLKNFQQQTHLQLKIIFAKHGGPGAARNQGIAHAVSEWVAFLDSDTLASENWIAQGIELTRKYPHAGGFEGCTELSSQEQITPFTHQTKNKKGGRYPTCNLILRRSLSRFHPGYHIAFREDTDLAFSVLEAGYEILFAPELIAFHPPLPPKYSRPIKLAKRYYYDGLLRKRFPERYESDVDVHYILGQRIPHLRRRIYGIYAGTQVAALLAGLFASTPVALGILAAHLITLMMVIRVHVHNMRCRHLKIWDLAIISSIACVVPWILIVQKVRGDWAYRNEPSFSKEKWLLAVKHMQLNEQKLASVISLRPTRQKMVEPTAIQSPLRASL